MILQENYFNQTRSLQIMPDCIKLTKPYGKGSDIAITSNSRYIDASTHPE